MLKVDRLAIVLATLGEERIGESERREAAGVVAQLTSPWVEELDRGVWPKLQLFWPG